ncbi:hypothetical protein CPB86DRAFT_790716 [Serendipita vermifera]|nr:hypothetical protein CPB86DRAFT_790716 [Serendipita vermifera]
MIFKGTIYTFAILVASTIAVPQISGTCPNQACTAANNQYKTCLASSWNNIKPCLCTEEFLSNYGRCLGGTICPWPARICSTVYCPGTFDGGFDANYFCGVTSASTSVPAPSSS